MMQIPSFNQFIDDMGKDYLDTIYKSHVTKMMGSYKMLCNDDFSKYTNDVISCSAQISLQILADYHEWLRIKLQA